MGLSVCCFLCVFPLLQTWFFSVSASWLLGFMHMKYFYLMTVKVWNLGLTKCLAKFWIFVNIFTTSSLFQNYTLLKTIKGYSMLEIHHIDITKYEHNAKTIIYTLEVTNKKCIFAIQIKCSRNWKKVNSILNSTPSLQAVMHHIAFQSKGCTLCIFPAKKWN